MVGAIVKRDILTHPWVTIRCFGWRVFLKALMASSNTTFLSLLVDSEALEPDRERVQNFVARCVELELGVSRFYESLSRRFVDQQPVHDFFVALARQENAHADLLELAELAAGRERWDERKAKPWQEALPRLEQQMERAISELESIHTVEEALRRVIDIESSEINDMFNGLIAASDSPFVRRIQAFRDTTARHLAFIRRAIAELEPALVPASEVLQRRVAA